MPRAEGTFDVQLTPQTDGSAEGAAAETAAPAIGRLAIAKQFRGELEATSSGQMLSAMGSVSGSAGYVALERVEGSLHGRRGSFVLQHSGTMDRGTPRLTVSVVPDSGSGELVGLDGTMDIIIEGGNHFYLFDYKLGRAQSDTPPAPRPLEQRKQDTLHRLEHDVDAWISTAAGGTGADTPYLVPLSFLWEAGTGTLLVSTPEASPTARNLLAGGNVRVGIGPTRDVVLIEGSAQAVSADELPSAMGDAFAEKTGFDPRLLRTRYLYFRIRPERVQAWREANELEGRDLMREGRWLIS